MRYIRQKACRQCPIRDIWAIRTCTKLLVISSLEYIEVQENMRREYDLNVLLTLLALPQAVETLSVIT